MDPVKSLIDDLYKMSEILRNNAEMKHLENDTVEKMQKVVYQIVLDMSDQHSIQKELADINLSGSVSEVLKRAREAKGLTIRGLARLSGVSQAYLSQIESGKKVPSARILRDIAECIGLDFSVLLEKTLTTDGKE